MSSTGTWLVVGGLIALLAIQGGAGAEPKPPTKTGADKLPPTASAFIKESDGNRWTVRNGLTIALQPDPLKPTGSPRGLIRIGLPLRPEDKEPDLLNYVAVEPITMDGWRGLSELEVSPSDHKPGLSFWFDKPIETENFLRLTIRMDKFKNGAHPYVIAELDKRRPLEVRFEVYAEPDSAPMKMCILTSTMGNFQRLRRLHLKDRVVTTAELFPQKLGDAFSGHAVFPLAEMTRNADGAYVEATGDEADPRILSKTINNGYMKWWAYMGMPFTQYWRQPNPVDPDLRVAVNSRERYYGQTIDIPGGKSFENFELGADFYPGQTFIFGVRRPEAGS